MDTRTPALQPAEPNAPPELSSMPGLFRAGHARAAAAAGTVPSPDEQLVRRVLGQGQHRRRDDAEHQRGHHADADRR